MILSGLNDDSTAEEGSICLDERDLLNEGLPHQGQRLVVVGSKREKCALYVNK